MGGFSLPCKITADLLLDLGAAFDLVDHVLLIGKHKLYGVGDTFIQWFTSCVCDQTQYVLVESLLGSALSTGEVGVPQGGILGPLLYLIFENDFPTSRNETAENLGSTGEIETENPGTNTAIETEEEGTSILYADDETDKITALDCNTL